MVGNASNYSKYDILRCFLRLEKNTSRKELASELNLGEGTVRSILGILKSNKLIGSGNKGHLLSNKGKNVMKSILKSISCPKSIKINEIYPGLIKIGIVARQAGKLNKPYKLRDIAVRNGAEGAIILKYGNNLYIPDSNYEFDYSALEKNFNLKKGDALIAALSSGTPTAEKGALAIAAEIVAGLQKFIKEAS